MNLILLLVLMQSVAPLPNIVVAQKDLGDYLIETVSAGEDCDIANGYLPIQGTYKVIRLTVHRQNIGNAALDLGETLTSPFFEPPPNATCSGYRMIVPDLYNFWTIAGWKAWTSGRNLNLPVTGTKNAIIIKTALFNKQLRQQLKHIVCLEDEYPNNPKNPAPISVPFGCSHQGLSVGWGDIYGKYMTGNFIDITGIAPGRYVLEILVNPDHVFLESKYTDNSASVQITIP